MNISKGKLQILLCVLAFLVALSTYFFVVQKYQDAGDIVSNDINKLQSDVNRLQMLKANQEQYKKQTADMTLEISTFLNQFPSEIRAEDAIMFAKNIEGFADNTSVTSVSIGNLSEMNKMKSTDKKYTNIGLYKEPVGLSYQCTYKGIKDMVYYINSRPEKMTIDTMSFSYDNTTGLLSGTATVNMYVATGTQTVYNPPVINNVPISKDNIFGTVKKPK